MSVRREELTPEWVEQVTRRIRAEGAFEPLSDEQRAESVRRMLKPLGQGEDVWVFGYGSLMWNPMVYFQEQRHGLLYGYHRRYCFQTRSGRATPETPSFGMGLDRGGSCRGMAFRIAGHERDEELRLLWIREMMSGVYIPRWLPIHTPGKKISAITFVADRSHVRYVRGVSPETTASRIARAKGPRGSAREYLENTVAHLAKLGFRDRTLSHLHRLVLQEAGE